MMNVEFVVVIIAPVLTVQAFQMVMSRIIVVPVIVMALMTVYRIVLVFGAELP
jgi:hypothetical protein